MPKNTSRNENAIRLTADERLEPSSHAGTPTDPDCFSVPNGVYKWDIIYRLSTYWYTVVPTTECEQPAHSFDSRVENGLGKDSLKQNGGCGAIADTGVWARESGRGPHSLILGWHLGLGIVTSVTCYLTRRRAKANS
jgi:hypothetical protein